MFVKRSFLLASSMAFAAALGAGAGACAPSSADDTASAEGQLQAGGEILALGDSITFGWDPNITPAGAPTARYKSYADELADGSTKLVNAACSGESSGSFLDASAPDNGCHGGEGALQWVKTPWNKPSQVEFAKAYLKAKMAENKPPKLVVITLGGNDMFLLSESCSLITCVTGLFAAASRYGENMKAIFHAIAETGYRGTIAVPNTYALDYGATLEKTAINKFNSALKGAADAANAGGGGMKVVVVDVFGAWEKAANGGSSCEAGLLLPGGDDEKGKGDDDDDDDDDKKPEGAGATSTTAKPEAEEPAEDKDEKGCDVHPSEKGRKLIAEVVRNATR